MFEAFKVHGQLFGLGPGAVFALWILSLIIDVICAMILLTLSEDSESEKKHYNAVFCVFYPVAFLTLFLTLYGLS